MIKLFIINYINYRQLRLYLGVSFIYPCSIKFLLLVVTVFIFPSLPNKPQFVLPFLKFHQKCSFLHLIGSREHANRWSASYSPPHFPSSFNPHFFILLAVFLVSVCNLFSVFHTDHDRWLPVGKLFFGSFHSYVSYVLSFPPSISLFLLLQVFIQ